MIPIIRLFVTDTEVYYIRNVHDIHEAELRCGVSGDWNRLFLDNELYKIRLPG